MDPEKRASDLRTQVRYDEIEKPRDYEASDVRQAIVHTREDLVLVVSYLSDAVHLLRPIKWLLVVIAVAAVVSAAVLVWPLLG